MTPATPGKPAPVLDELSEQWQEAARDGRFLIQRRRHDNGYQWYPRAHALGTLDADVDWVEASGTGRLHTFTVVYRTANAEFADDCPYVLGIVELDEGPRVTTRIVDADPDTLKCDQPVRVRLDTTPNQDYVLPVFVSTGEA